MLSLIHTAAFDVAAWGPVLHAVAQMTGSVAGGLTIENHVTRTGRPITYFGFDPDHVTRTFQHFLPMNPLFAIEPQMLPGAVIRNGDAIALADFKQTDFYNGWSRPQGLGCTLSLVLHRSTSTYAPLTLVRSADAGEASEADCQVLAQLAPHLVQAWQTNIRLGLVQSRVVALERALAQFSIAVFVVDASRTLLFCNGAGEAMLRAGTPLKAARGQLGSCDAASDARVQAALGRALAGERLQASSITVTGLSGRPVTLSVTPCSVGQTVGGDGVPDRGALVTASDEQGVARSRLQAFASAYRLTLTEARLVGAMLDGSSLAEAAAALNVKHGTARTYLKSIFAKTGISRQAELIQRVYVNAPDAGARIAG